MENLFEIKAYLNKITLILSCLKLLFTTSLSITQFNSYYCRFYNETHK